MFQDYFSVIAQGIPTSLLLTLVSLLIAFFLALFLTFLLFKFKTSSFILIILS